MIAFRTSKSANGIIDLVEFHDYLHGLLIYFIGLVQLGPLEKVHASIDIELLLKHIHAVCWCLPSCIKQRVYCSDDINECLVVVDRHESGEDGHGIV